MGPVCRYTRPIIGLYGAPTQGLLGRGMGGGGGGVSFCLVRKTERATVVSCNRLSLALSVVIFIELGTHVIVRYNASLREYVVRHLHMVVIVEICMIINEQCNPFCEECPRMD